MLFIYVVSAREAAGKTMIAASLGKHLMGAGKKVGFLKPVAGKDGTGDAVFMSRMLGLTEAVDFICSPAATAGEVQQACAVVSREKDAVIIESILAEHLEDNYEVARKLDARVIIVEDYSQPPARGVAGYQGFGKNLLGVVMNKVPQRRLAQVKAAMAAQCSKAGVSLLGVLPEDRLLAALSVGEMAECVQGKILDQGENKAELVENVMLGALVVGSGVEYFGRKANKAAVVRSDRPDMQLAALETSTRCLVITGAKGEPVYSVRQKAESRGIPVIATGSDTNAVIAGIEACLKKSRFSQEKKLARFTEMMKQYLDFKVVEKGLR